MEISTYTDKDGYDTHTSGSESVPDMTSLADVGGAGSSVA